MEVIIAIASTLVMQIGLCIFCFIKKSGHLKIG